jgi:NADH-quinone oxidoreductase subunit F
VRERPLTAHLRQNGEALALADYERGGGYRALAQALGELGPSDVTETVKESGLRGRGGAGFPTGTKWGFVPKPDEAPRPRYFIGNADEMEPGTFKDRLLLEGNPHLFLEGLILGSYAIQADVAYIFLRWAYRDAAKRLTRAIGEAYDRGYLGKNIRGSGYDLELRLHVSAGRYMCGEETALLNALEGRRATPRAKPPFPPVVGLFGKPTVVNNVETLCNVPHIVAKGAQWFKDLGRGDASGTKLYGMSGHVNRPGAWELPMGTELRELVEDHAGGMRDGFRFRGALPGGASTDFLLEDHLDVPMDFDPVEKAGSRLGTGTVIILDDKTCPVGFVENLEHFFAGESCGWCTPCREGVPWVEKILHAIETGEGRAPDLDILERHAKLLGPGMTYCAFAPGAMEPLQSGLRFFREDFERHIELKRCPWR